MNIIKSITKTIVRAPADIVAGALEAVTEGLDVIGDAFEDKPEGKKRK